ncbi:hypothetical protein [Flavobacterium phycosphaerae]|uniref:hypothetical protein n=1 Tax=Flavobacterium phycosphaerae TaxID=2697515 RepID=UPI0013899558|nr:hypothetical protein [Flavobacterium phycosphaerae]
MTLLNQKFKAPKAESKEWETINFLVAHGFKYQSIYTKKEDGLLYKVDYPKNIKDAKEFVVNYKEQALKE